MVYTLEMMEHPVKMEVVGGKFLGKSMILSMNKPSLNSCPMWKYQLHTRPPNQRLFCCARDLIPVLARTQARRCCIPPGVHHKKFKIEIPRNGHVHYKKYILTSPASTVSLSSGCFFPWLQSSYFTGSTAPCYFELPDHTTGQCVSHFHRIRVLSSNWRKWITGWWLWSRFETPWAGSLNESQKLCQWNPPR